MIGALKHGGDPDIKHYLSNLTRLLNSIDFTSEMRLKFVNTLLYYLMRVGNTKDFKQFIHNGQQLTEPVRGEFMTIAEQLKAMGAEEAREATQEEIAIKSLKENADPRFIERITGLDLKTILELKAQLD